MILEPKAIERHKQDALEQRARVKAIFTARGVADKGRMPGFKAWPSLKEANLCGVGRDKNSGDVITATATCDRLDLDREILLPGGADTSYIDANKAVFVDHCYDWASIVGHVKRLNRTPDAWKFEARMLPDSGSAAVRLITACAMSFGIGVSVGFDPIDYGDPTPDELRRYPGAECIIRKYRLLEISFTGMPCNVSCRSDEVWVDDSLVTPAKAFLKVEDRKLLRLERERPMLVLR